MVEQSNPVAKTISIVGLQDAQDFLLFYVKELL